MIRIGCFGAGCLLSLFHGLADAQTVRFEFSRALMGTQFRIVLFADDTTHARSAAERAFLRIAELDRIMSDYLPDSELNELSRRSGGGLMDVSDDLWTVLAYAQRIARESRGSFDVTVGPLTRLWRRAMRRGGIPDSLEIQRALRSVGFHLLRLDSTSTRRRGIRLDAPDMRLDLGGIAKGFAVDRAFEILVDAGYGSVLVDGGGDMRLGDPPPDRNGWAVSISGTGRTDTLSNTAIAQSGSTYRFVEVSGIRYSHTVDPRSGYGLTGRRLVTVWAPTCMEADALASAMSVARPETRISLERLHPSAQIHIQDLQSE